MSDATILESSSVDAIVAGVRTGEVSRDQLVLPPGLHKHGRREKTLALVLAEFGAPYADEMIRLVEQSYGHTHSALVWRFDQLYRGKLAPELFPVLAKVIASEHTSTEARAKAIWVACACGARAAPLLEELLVAVQTGDYEVQRAAASVLALIDPPAERALPILEPMLERVLPKVGVEPWRLHDLKPYLVTATAAVKPPPIHLASSFEAVLRRVLATGGGYDTKVLAFALAKVAPDRAIAMLDDADLPAREHGALVSTMIESRDLPAAIRLPWVVRTLDAGRGGLLQADELSTATNAPLELIAPLVQRLATTDVKRVCDILVRHDHSRVLRALAPSLGSDRVIVRDHALQLLMALGEGDAVMRFLVDPEPSIVRRTVRWLALHGGTHLLAHLDREARCAD